MAVRLLARVLAGLGDTTRSDYSPRQPQPDYLNRGQGTTLEKAMRTRGIGARRRAATIATALFAASLGAPAGAAADPDLVVATVRRLPAFAEPGQGVTVGDTVKNRGNNAASASVVRYLLSKDGKVSSGDLKIGRRRVARLAPGGKSADTARATIPPKAPAGIYYLLACADGDRDVAESSERNNCRRSTTSMLVEAFFTLLA